MTVKEGRVDEVAESLESALPLAGVEEQTTTWFALRLDGSTFGIFDTFPDEDGAEAHVEDEMAEKLFAKADELLVDDPEITEMEVLAAKHQ
jgi:quinol monooxygenase YgiN